ncbi:MAG: hypothetical protein OXC79_04540 [Candidatus Poribacteria bacterium]|nr:hypothetical protein [Candidatus Poribacteria bacterium]
MEQINMKINSISAQHCGKSQTNALTALQDILRMKDGFEILKKGGYLPISIIGGLLIILISITGCSDVPYTGPTLTVGHVDQYLNAIEQDTVCLQDGFDTVCVKLLLDKTEVAPTDIDYVPTVHVHPTNIAYVFNYQGRTILEAKRLMDTSQIVQELVEAGRAELPSDVDLDSGDTNYIPEGWSIEIYYPSTFREANRGNTPETSGLDIRIAEGVTIPTNRRSDLKITEFTQINKNDGRRGIRFSIKTQVPEITVQVDGVVPANIATFHINGDSVAADNNQNILRLQPIE